MKLKFKRQQYQLDATDSVVKCFDGQKKGIRKEIIDREIIPKKGQAKDLYQNIEIFSNNTINITEDDILKNVQQLQRSQGLRTSPKLDGLNFTIEMETGTGKTYVYTKTMYELNKLYGWSKFIIMVPSVAIREGVNKSLQITSEHFQEESGKKIRFCIYNTNNKSNLINIKNFANTSNIEVIIMNYQAFATRSEESRKIFHKLDSLQSETPFDIIKRTRPILIIDEPQRFGEKAEEIFTARKFEQLFTLRYSATHKRDFNKIYRLDAIDAYNQRLVKKISVRGIDVIGNSGTNNYIYLDRIEISTKTFPVAHIELEIKHLNTIKKTIRKIREKDDLFALSNEMLQYKGFIVKEINGLKNTVSFTNGFELQVGQSTGNVDEEHIRRIQIRETIKSHLEKERLMFMKGIKVLSLFFIDEVAKYRDYGVPDQKGTYAKIFEDEYNNAIRELSLFEEDYNKYLQKHTTENIHKGYFSIDKKGNFINSAEKRGEVGSDDESAYNLIMKNKEKLLSFDEPTRFIFSHSALREGWDNPNVFQICTLKHSQSTISKRQEIGRGLRICVNANGDRMDSSVLENQFFNINKLTVIASESYDNFAKKLQEEIVDSLSNRPLTLTPNTLKDIVIENDKGDKYTFTELSSMNLISDFKNKEYADNNYNITEKLVQDIKDNKFEVIDELKDFKTQISKIMVDIYNTATFKPADNDKANNINQSVLKPNDNFAKNEFKDLWNKIKIKTVYEVNFDTAELIKKAVFSIDNNLMVKKVKVIISSGEQKDKIDESSLKEGDSMEKHSTQTLKADSLLGELKYDLVNEISKTTNLTRKTIVNILKDLNEKTFLNFRVNPESFISEVSRIINNEKATTLINNITYSKTDKTYSDDVFTINNFQGEFKKNIIEVKKHIYDYLRFDSNIEMKFAEEMEKGEIIVYAKLPNDFKIPTPIGNYNPDWAIVFNNKEFKHVYFIAETKGSMDTMKLRGTEKTKIDYARKHFEALGHKDIKYDVIDTYENLMQVVGK